MYYYRNQSYQLRPFNKNRSQIWKDRGLRRIFMHLNLINLTRIYNNFIKKITGILIKGRDWIKLKIKSEKYVSIRIILATQIHMAFQGPLLNCFEEIEKILLSYQPKDLVHALPQILEMFFNFDGSLADDMNFGRLTTSQAYEFEVARHFFGLESTLISLVAKIATDPNCFMFFEFPFGCLPLATRNSILSGRHPTYYASKLKIVGASVVPEAVYLDAFDLFIFHFAYYVVNPHNWKIMHLIREPSYRSEWIYSALFNVYLNAFFPPGPDVLPVRMAKLRPHPVRRPLGQEVGASQHPDAYGVLESHVGYSPGPGQIHASEGTPFNQLHASSFQQSLNSSLGQSQYRPQPHRIGQMQSLSPGGFYPTVPNSPGSVPRVSKLINIDPQLLLQLNDSNKLDSSTMTTTTANDTSTAANRANQCDLFSCSDATLQIFVDFWLNQFDSSALEQHVWLTNKMLKIEDFLLLVRVLVKHLHLFANSTAEDPRGSQASGSSSPHFRGAASNPHGLQVPRNAGMTQEQREWNEFKRNVWSPWLCSKLYNFLKYHFTYGPIERPLVEIWLSFIQPWRYTTTSQQQHGVDSPRRSPQLHHDGERYVEHRWIPFVRRHLLFYTSFLQLMIERFLALDFNSSANSLILGRVAKVFSIRCLGDIIREVETSLGSGTSNPSGLFLDGTLPANQRVLAKELEGEALHFRPLFSHETRAKVTRLISNVLVAKEGLESQLITNQMETSRRSWFQRIANLFSSDEDSAYLLSVQKGVDQLAVSANQILVFFEISMNELPRLPVPAWSRRSGYGGRPQAVPGGVRDGWTASRSDALDDLPDLEIKEDGSFALTPLGRHEILTKKKKFDLEYMGDPDLQPIRSWEFAPLVTFFQKFCENINGKYSREIAQAVRKPGPSGTIARLLFRSPRCDSSPLPAPDSNSTPPRSGTVGFTTPRKRTNRFTPGGFRDTPKLMLSPASGRQNDRDFVPRLSLRFLARYSTLLFFVVFILSIKIWFGLEPTTVFVLFGLVVVACFTVVSRIVLSCSQGCEEPATRRALFTDPPTASPSPSSTGSLR